jgi:sec-independent protein translocase protein TatA
MLEHQSHLVATTLFALENDMGGMSLMHWLIVGAVGLLVFGGRGKLSAIMKDAAEGIKGFRAGLSDEKTPAAKEAEKVNDNLTVEATTKSKTEA